jgi:hypothetical protein
VATLGSQPLDPGSRTGRARTADHDAPTHQSGRRASPRWAERPFRRSRRNAKVTMSRRAWEGE